MQTGCHSLAGAVAPSCAGKAQQPAERYITSHSNVKPLADGKSWATNQKSGSAHPALEELRRPPSAATISCALHGDIRRRGHLNQLVFYMWEPDISRRWRIMRNGSAWITQTAGGYLLLTCRDLASSVQNTCEMTCCLRISQMLIFFSFPPKWNTLFCCGESVWPRLTYRRSNKTSVWAGGWEIQRPDYRTGSL